MKSPLLRYALIATLAGLLAAIPVVSRSDDDAAAVAMALVDAPHPFAEMNGPEYARLMDFVRSNPSAFIGVLMAYVSDAKVSSDATALRRAQNGAAILIAATGEPGRAAVAARLAEIRGERDRINDELADLRSRKQLADSEIAAGHRLMREADHLAALEATSLIAFGVAGDPRMVEVAASRQNDPNLQLGYVEYLIVVAPGDGRMCDALRKLAAGPPSPAATRAAVFLAKAEKSCK